jgi:hypothetical protein
MIRRLATHRPAAVAALLLALPMSHGGCAKGDGVVTGAVVIDADVDRGLYVLYSFATNALLEDGGAPIVTDDPSAHEGWDIAASRWVLATPSGSSAPAGSLSRGALLAVEGQVDAWASLADYDGRCSDYVATGETANTGGLGCGARSPTVDDGFVSDALDDPDGAGPYGELTFNPSLAFWFQYDFSTHEVEPFGNVYVVETADGRCVKVQFTDYYDVEGGGGQIAFDWEYLAD